VRSHPLKSRFEGQVTAPEIQTSLFVLREKAVQPLPRFLRSQFQSGISGSSPHKADPTRLALADPKWFAAENGELINAL
jgi:hypothetical protein